MVYGDMNGIYSGRKLEKACQKNIDFMRLLDGECVSDHNTVARFRTGWLGDAIEGLLYQHARRLEAMGETDHEAVFIDGTKTEGSANRDIFVWRKDVEKHLSGVKEKAIKALSACGLDELPTIEALEKLPEEGRKVRRLCIRQGQAENAGATNVARSE